MASHTNSGAELLTDRTAEQGRTRGIEVDAEEQIALAREALAAGAEQLALPGVEFLRAVGEDQRATLADRDDHLPWQPGVSTSIG